MLYGISFFSFSRIKMIVFLALVSAWFIGSAYYVYSEYTISWAPIELLIPSIVFVVVSAYVFAAFTEYMFYKVRRKWPRWF